MSDPKELFLDGGTLFGPKPGPAAPDRNGQKVLTLLDGVAMAAWLKALEGGGGGGLGMEGGKDGGEEVFRGQYSGAVSSLLYLVGCPMLSTEEH